MIHSKNIYNKKPPRNTNIKEERKHIKTLTFEMN